MKWSAIKKANIGCKEYAVFGYRLVDDQYYGEDGMADYPTSMPQNEWELEICNWYDKGYGGRVAGPASSTRYYKVFKDRNEANAMWKHIKTNEPDWESLKKLGFKRH